MTQDVKSLVAIDVETSGIDPLKNQLLSVSFVPFDESTESLDVYIAYKDIKWGYEI